MADKRTVEEELKRTEKEVADLRYALDQSSIIAFTDAKGVITYVNDKFCQISKYSREELIGQTHRIINSRHHPKEFFVSLWKTISSGRVWTGEIKNRAKDGSYYWVFTTIVPFMTAQGRPFQYVAIRTDITEFKLAQEERERQRAALIHAEKLASAGELAGGIAHELGNPLATISGRMELLELLVHSGKASKEEILGTIQTVKGLTDRMSSIMRGMRSLSRDGRADPAQKISLGRLIKDVLGLSDGAFARDGIRVVADEIDEDLEIWCQETQIGQVFVNLVNNARDAVLPLSDRWIKIELRDAPDAVEVAITDSGPGIPAELRQKVMDPFFTTKPPGKGSGLGLSVSRTIVESHGGSIRIDTGSPNTRFVVSLPKNPAP